MKLHQLQEAKLAVSPAKGWINDTVRVLSQTKQLSTSRELSTSQYNQVLKYLTDTYGQSQTNGSFTRHISHRWSIEHEGQKFYITLEHFDPETYDIRVALPGTLHVGKRIPSLRLQEAKYAQHPILDEISDVIKHTVRSYIDVDDYQEAYDVLTKRFGYRKFLTKDNHIPYWRFKVNNHVWEVILIQRSNGTSYLRMYPTYI